MTIDKNIIQANKDFCYELKGFISVVCKDSWQILSEYLHRIDNLIDLIEVLEK